MWQVGERELVVERRWLEVVVEVDVMERWLLVA